MADQQRMRIHPLDLESGAGVPHQQRPTAPLVPNGSFRSHKGHPSASSLPPPPRRVAPPMPLPPPKRRRGCCCRLICCVTVTVILLAVIAAAAAAALYLAFDPKAPRYSVSRLSVSAFQVDPTLTATARLDVTVTATNPNARIGIHYEPGSSLAVYYAAHRLAAGELPPFYQGHRNTTVLAVAMSGRAQLGGAAMSALRDAQTTGAVPLVFRAEVPVRVQLGGLRLWRVTSRVTCDLVVDSLGVNNPINIKASNCKFGLKL
uniref:Late embryogenesis abundant protein LEA-2 subgroup domain-containing protein n=1 Tax=Leersia perrieri TaxID=77586 RepID=A0A0D9XKY3_9ORYZ